MIRERQYTDDYLNQNRQRVLCGMKPVTVRTYLRLVFRGRSKYHVGAYENALTGALELMMAAGDVMEVHSARGRTVCMYSDDARQFAMKAAS